MSLDILCIKQSERQLPYQYGSKDWLNMNWEKNVEKRQVKQIPDFMLHDKLSQITTYRLPITTELRLRFNSSYKCSIVGIIKDLASHSVADFQT